ncbi:MAG: AMIN domain-containing protein [Oscillatoriales cyanobacterium RM2_1_1]|nr:AMIN domain-containing protein [Oscillatoriales cyanobacterium SM2_3_0]NJO45388.1 AMIN domain-containing protein [Oscillatoriales cyanobacterium RM2_1_1]
MQHPQQIARFQAIKPLRQLGISTVLGYWLLTGVKFRVGTLMTLASFAAWQTLAPSAQAAILQNWKFDPRTGQLEVQLREGVTPRLVVLSQPGRLVLDLPETEIGVTVTELYETGLVRQVSLTQFEEKTARITIEFAPDVILDQEEIELREVGVENSWIVRPGIVSAAPLPEPEVLPLQSPQATPTSEAEPPTGTTGTAEDLGVLTPEPQPISPPSTPDLNTPFSIPRPITPVIPNPQPQRESDVEIISVGLGRSSEVESIVDPVLSGELFGSGTSSETEPEPDLPTASPARVREDIVFGQPLPLTQAPSTTSNRPPSINQRPPNIVLLEGTQLVLVYPNPGDTRLPAKRDRQEVMLLQGGIVDRGAILLCLRIPQ